MFYIDKLDLEDHIKQDNLQQVARKDRYIRNAIAAAVQECKSYLKNYYDIDTIFALDGELNLYSNSATYAANARVYWEADTYVPASTYNTDDYCSYTSSSLTYIYICTENGVTGAFDATKWTKLYENGEFFYSIAAANTGNYPDDTTKWTRGNPQDAKLRQVHIDISLYYLHLAVNPVQVPDQRIQNWESALDWLKRLNFSNEDGRIKADLPFNETYTAAEQVIKIEYGSNTKQSWR
ncbi:MAG: hypothetical protein GY861_05450 [bacterium]|nr:hypothetical protein [bacterium]